ncbi:hypothetical protein FHT87_005905 [Rhizobium sp. BK316]|uniref:hypothetical protein n=1 Tax=Rhizobium sp. BK316 TaxID=2587053 RepID=UPI001607A5FE|nr:hypothetical protein [Rhizobium sp. BK316]MBB3411938.1 hypothetical protein [Rhizobium sp. BK316]
MPTILYLNDPSILPDEIRAVATFVEHVGQKCFDEFSKGGEKARSDSLASKVRDVIDGLDFGADPVVPAKIAKRIVDLYQHVGGDCFDTFGDGGHMGKSVELLRLLAEVDAIIEKLVVYQMSAEEEELAQAIWADDAGLYVPFDDNPGTAGSGHRLAAGA